MRGLTTTAIVLSGTLFATAALAEGDEKKETSPSVDTATEGQKVRATNAYMKGMKLFEDNEHDAALEAFRESYDHVRSPNARFMIARTMARMGDNVEAYQELQATIEEATELGGRYENTADSARAKRAEVAERIGLVMIDLVGMPKGTKVTIGETTYAENELTGQLAVLPGEVTARAVTPKGEQFEATETVEMGSTKTITIENDRADTEDEDDGGSDDSSDDDKTDIKKETDHPDYLIEVEPHGAVTTLEPPGPASTGFGVGGRVGVNVLNTGLIPRFNDSIAISGGFEWVATGDEPHYWIPVVLQWNFWFTKRFALMAEPGGAFMFGAGEFTRPSMAIGVRYMLAGETLAVTARAGLPVSTVGVSLMF